MKNILHLFKRDVQNVSRSVIGMVVVMGLIIVPCLYAWFNIAGSWDPYGNTGNLKIAVVNTDEGYESDLIPVEINVGENVTATLRGNENFDWVVLNDRDKAIEGVKSGAYYAAVVIPKTFSADMMTLFSTEVKHADIEFYENQKANAIAQIVTEKGSSAVQSQVNETFTKTITTIGLKTVSSLLDYMSTDQVSNFIANLSSTLGDSVEDLQDVQASATSLAGILSSTSDSLISAGGMLKQTGTVDESTKQLMEHAKSGIDDSKEALKAANDAIDAAIDGSAGSFDNVSAELAKAFDAANQHVDLTVSQLNEAAAALNTRADDIDAMADRLRSLADQVSDDKLKDGLKSAATSLGRIAVEYRNNAKDLTATAKSLSDGMAEVNNSRAEVDQAIADAKAGISGAKSDYDSTFSVKAKELKKTISGVLDSLNGISGDLDSAVSGLTDASGSLAKGLSKAAKLVNKASDQLGEASDKISAFKDELDGALMSDDLATIKTMIGNDPEGLAVSLSGPVALDRKPVYPIRNYGSAMAPFYTILSLSEDTLLHAMETASADSMPEGVERQGIGTPATRAATIEKLVQKGFLERKGTKKNKVLLPTDKGKALITVMPEEIQSPEMTADWETKLLRIERSEMEPGEFMTEINTMITELVKNTEMKKGANALMKSKIIGVCPNCGKPVVEREKGWFCENRECRFVLWKDNAFFKRLGKRLDAHVADKLLRDGRVRLKDCKSAKGKTYNATVLLSCEADGRSKFSLEFEGGC